MSLRTQAVKAYMVNLLQQWYELQREEVALQQAATRLTEITAEKAALVADAQAALDKYNALEGTSYTLAQIRNQIQPPAPLPPVGP